MELPFFKRKELPPMVTEDKTEQLVSLMELNSNPVLLAKLESEMKNMVDTSSYFQAFEAADDSGNYFGTEFNIRATAGRIKGTFSREPWMYATATLIAKAMSLVPFNVIDNVTDEVLPDHPLNQKIKTGNKFQDGKTLTWCGYLDLILGGNFFRVYDEFFQESMQVPVELCTLNFDPTSRTITSLKIWDNNLGQYKREIPYRQCVHMKLPNPYNPFYGLSLYIAASRPMIMDRAMQEFQMAFYLRGATNTGVIETTEDINKTRMERLMRTFEAVYTGKRNWWRTIFLPKGAKWVKSSLSMAEMQHLDALKENRLTFLATIGVPPSKVGIVQDVNRSTSEVQDETFWENTIKPLCEAAASSWNNSYLVKVVYANRVRVEPDFSGIEALNGNMVSKGEQAKAVETVLTINELRTDILGYDPLPPDDARGNKFVAEIKPAQPAGAPAPTLAAPITELPAATVTNTVANLGIKAGATASQERIEKKLGSSYLQGYDKYLEMLMSYVRVALHEGKDVGAFIKENQKALARTYVEACEPELIAAMERGFSFANAQSKTIPYAQRKAVVKAGATKIMRPVAKSARFREIDQEAIDALRREQSPAKREALLKRSIESFVGFNDTDTNRILDIIASDLADGKSTDQIAADIRGEYDTAYPNQSSTIARTEILSAVSDGIKWNHDVLGEVFSDVQKQWFHVGDGASNPHARQNHVDFEDEGAVPSDYKWGGVLDYPRDPAGGAEEVINCRCTMVSVVPETATSNAEVILDNP